MIKDVKDLNKNRMFMVNLSRGQIGTDAMRKVFETFTSEAFAKDSGFVSQIRSDHQRAHDVVVADTMWKLAVNFVGSLSQSFKLFEVPPLCFLGLTSSDEMVKKATMEHLNKLFVALEKLESEAHATDTECKDFLDNLLWPLNQWVREIFVALNESDWDAALMPLWLVDELTAYSRAHFSSLLCENMLWSWPLNAAFQRDMC